jgi:hypothetical protein
VEPQKIVVGTDEDGEDVSSLVLTWAGLKSEAVISKQEETTAKKLMDIIGKMPQTEEAAVSYLEAAQALGWADIDQDQARARLADHFKEAVDRGLLRRIGGSGGGKASKSRWKSRQGKDTVNRNIP